MIWSKMIIIHYICLTFISSTHKLTKQPTMNFIRVEQMNMAPRLSRPPVFIVHHQHDMLIQKDPILRLKLMEDFKGWRNLVDNYWVLYAHVITQNRHMMMHFLDSIFVYRTNKYILVGRKQKGYPKWIYMDILVMEGLWEEVLMVEDMLEIMDFSPVISMKMIVMA
ncbi:hypothetical protein Bca4012_010748 [Brassica carinata]